MYKIGWFSTANGKTSQLLLSAVMDSILSGQLKASIPFVFVSRERGENLETDNFLNMAEGYGLNLVTLSFDKFRAEHALLKRSEVRKLYDARVIEMLKPYPCDIAVLAGYMLITSDEMCHAYKMINLHPALPNGPKGTWREVVWQLIDERAQESGAMMHLVTPELDRGPVMTYCRYSLRGEGFDSLWQENGNKTAREIKDSEGEFNALFQKIRCEGVRREFPLIIDSLKAFAEGNVYIKNHCIYTKDGCRVDGFNVTDKVEKALQ